MENNNTNETSGQIPEETVVEVTADNNGFSTKLIDRDENHVTCETEVKDNCVFHSIVESPRTADQSQVLMSVENNAEYPPSLSNHNSILHTTNTFDCSVCDEKFDLKLDLDQHAAKTHNNNIDEHVQIILNPDDAHDINCIDASNSKHLEDEKSDCNSKSKNDIAKHVEVHKHHSSYKGEYMKSLELISKPVYETLTQNVEKKSMKCPRCNIKFEKKYLYDRHIQICRKRLYEKKNFNDDKFVCTVCESHFSTALLLKKHILITREHWICEYCDIVIGTSELWSKHVDFRKLHNVCLKVDETCVKRGRNTNVKNTINSTLVKGSNVTERKLTIRSRSNNTTIKPEPIHLELGNRLTANKIKQEPMDLDHGNRLTANKIKQEPMDLDHGDGLTANSIKQEPMDLDHGDGLIVNNIKQEPMDLDHSDGLTAYDKRNITVDFPCTSCEMSLSNIHSLALHMATHEYCSMYKCQPCQKHYKRISSWINHLKNHQHQLDLIMSQDIPEALECDINSTVLRTFEAHITGLKSINKNIKLEPPVNASPTVLNSGLTETNNFESEQSNSVNEAQQNESVEHLNNLLNTRNRVIKKEPTENQCNVCQKQFVDAINLTRHMHIHAALQMPYKCQFCDRAFKTRGNLTNHMKGFQCPIKKEQPSTRKDENPEILVNTRATNLQTKRNELAAHNTIQIPEPFMCKICARSFTTCKGVKLHLRSHYWNFNIDQRDEAANKNYALKHCNQCEKKFSEIGALRAHIKAQHPSIEYKCNDCGKRFSTNFLLGVHIVNTH